ncbi:MAG: haloacid dehalogenase, partial [Candidatus Hydrothermarchaeota archaeon]|nr:haloacid dehalogenase [Candidatus Hydrothermarchaeota archaeon]
MIKGVFFDIDDTLYDSTKLATMARRNSIQARIDAGLDV